MRRRPSAPGQKRRGNEVGGEKGRARGTGDRPAVQQGGHTRGSTGTSSVNARLSRKRGVSAGHSKKRLKPRSYAVKQRQTCGGASATYRREGQWRTKE